ncbi:NmrA family NAD(P)-binding protein [Glaciihabitans sp. dw_435]|uniref:NmrA family NAD(P)-binding protein n=1 Tax=Glaciihabitans sp. dw_435 TaxID=2720081 RepID=UPI001BD1CBB6|nr:NmrA family NAD(P)-binding protein [Glaciihabitans sp. dw_435]
MTIALTGTSGNIGRKVLERLGGEHVLIGRDLAKLPAGGAHREAAYGDTDAMTTALAGVETLFFVSGREAPNRLEEHFSVVAAAFAAGVERIVYLSFLGNSENCTFTFGRHHYFTEQRIRETGMKFTFLQDSLYQDYLPFMTDPEGVIRGPAGDGTVSAVSTDDVADVAATILRAAADGDPVHDGVTYRVTGPEALTLDDVAAALQKATGRPVRYERETEAEAYASRAKFNAPDFEVEGWVTSYQAIAAGDLSAISDDVQRVTGHAPQSFDEFLLAHPESYQHLLS